MTMQVKGKVYIVGLTTLILFGIFTLNLYAQSDPICKTRRIKLTILDETSNNPVNDATLTITGNIVGEVVNDELVDENEYKGQLETRLEYNPYTFKVSHPDYQDYQGNINLSGGCGSIEKTVRMIK